MPQCALPVISGEDNVRFVNRHGFSHKALNSVGEAMGSVLHGVPSGKSVKELFAGMEEHMIKVCDLASETGSPAYQFMASLVRAAAWETALELKKKGQLVL